MEQKSDAAPALPAAADSTSSAPLPDKVTAAVSAWESAAVESLGPHLSTPAFNMFTELRANLRAAIAAALS